MSHYATTDRVSGDIISCDVPTVAVRIYDCDSPGYVCAKAESFRDDDEAREWVLSRIAELRAGRIMDGCPNERGFDVEYHTVQP